MPASTFAATGFGFTSEKMAQGKPAASSCALAAATIGIFASTGSVTSRGRERPAFLTASASSEMRPAPKRTEVG